MAETGAAGSAQARLDELLAWMENNVDWPEARSVIEPLMRFMADEIDRLRAEIGRKILDDATARTIAMGNLEYETDENGYIKTITATNPPKSAPTATGGGY